MTKPSGVFSTKGTYYENNERCRWKFEVAQGKVRECYNCCFNPKITSFITLLGEFLPYQINA